MAPQREAPKAGLGTATVQAMSGVAVDCLGDSMPLAFTHASEHGARPRAGGGVERRGASWCHRRLGSDGVVLPVRLEGAKSGSAAVRTEQPDGGARLAEAKGRGRASSRISQSQHGPQLASPIRSRRVGGPVRSPIAARGALVLSRRTEMRCGQVGQERPKAACAMGALSGVVPLRAAGQALSASATGKPSSWGQNGKPSAMAALICQAAHRWL